jgi:hypothetical protein
MVNYNLDMHIFRSNWITEDAHNAIQIHIPLFVTLLSRQDLDFRFSIIRTLSKLSVDRE